MAKVAYETAERPARRAFLRQASAAGLFTLGGCATGAAPPPATKPAFRPVPPLARVDARPGRIMNITVCLRPFRAAGPRLDTETVGDKLVVHNYGHGGSGWSLSWGSGMVAVRKALSAGARDIAVIGCGALGLTAAVVAQRAGASVTIYAKERMPDVRSARATGVWSPDSRIATAAAAPPEFPALWEEMTRSSFRMFQSYLGLPGSPIEWIDRYVLSDAPPSGRADPVGFAHYGGWVRDLTPPMESLPPGSHPFPTAYARRASLPMFNIAEYARVLTAEFLQNGGRIETAEFHAPADLTSLKQRAIINCTGYGARALWKDESLVPVRGQIAWLIPQPEVNYGLVYDGVFMLGRRDGIVIQQTGPDESWGYDDANEQPDRAEAEAAVAAIARVYA
ncbi:FAD-dependent oxidoreductase [Phenylobacterium sp.]|uniref:FAD-dependent oxidoreductase n=1 Tax=Phenylobacterium sp. TaxID=1871053 RepID=UPI002FE0C309